MKQKILGLRPKQKAFCLEYLKCFDATKAAIAAGYSKKSARVTGYDNLRNPALQSFMAKGLQKSADKVDLTIEKILSHLINMSFFDPATIIDEETGDILPIHQWPLAARQVVQGFDVETRVEGSGRGDDRVFTTITVKKVRFPAREKNTENLGRYLAMFVDRVKVTVDPSEVIHYYVPVFRTADNQNGPSGQLVEPAAVNSEPLNQPIEPKQLAAGNGQEDQDGRHS